MSYQKIEVAPIAGTLGAEIRGIDLSNTLDDETFAEVRQAFHENLVVFFRNQTLTPAQHRAFASRFGELDIHPFAKGLNDFPEVLPIVKEPSDRAANFGGTWHTDVTFYEKPALGSILYALDVPESGGDTMFANMYAAYDALSDGLKRMLDRTTAIHSATRVYGSANSRAANRQKDGGKSMQIRTGFDAEATVEHPVIRTHPETGRKALFVNRNFTLRFKDWTDAESAPLLEYLHEHAVRPEFTCRFRWQPRSLAFWDNRCTQHYALNDYHGQRREMHRVSVIGDRPV